MKEFRQVIPQGMEARVENGEVIYTPIEESKCPFNVGDVILYENTLRIMEGVHNCIVESSKRYVYGVLINENYGLCRSVEEYTKATPEQEALFNQKCLENKVWFDRDNKKWLELKEGGVYRCDVVGASAVFIFDRVSSDGIFSKASIFKSGYVFIGGENCIYNELGEFSNISEATEEQKQQLFDALKKEGKQWNAEKKRVENVKWKPEINENYWFIDGTFTIAMTKNDSYRTHLLRIEAENCFKSKEECEKYAEYMKQCSLNYK